MDPIAWSVAGSILMCWKDSMTAFAKKATQLVVTLVDDLICISADLYIRTACVFLHFRRKLIKISIKDNHHIGKLWKSPLHVVFIANKYFSISCFWLLDLVNAPPSTTQTSNLIDTIAFSFVEKWFLNIALFGFRINPFLKKNEDSGARSLETLPKTFFKIC